MLSCRLYKNLTDRDPKSTKANKSQEEPQLNSLFLLTDIVDVELVDFSAVEDAHGDQVVEDALDEDQVPEQERVEVLHPAHFST